MLTKIPVKNIMNEEIGHVAYLVIEQNIFFSETDHVNSTSTKQNYVIESIKDDLGITSQSGYFFIEITTHLSDPYLNSGEFAVKIHFPIPSKGWCVYTITRSATYGNVIFDPDFLWTLPPIVKRQFADLIGEPKLEIANEGYPGRG